MKKIDQMVRTVAIAGLSLLAGAGIGTPALAADDAARAAMKPEKSAVAPYLPGLTEVVGFYRSPRACERAGWIGQRRGFWTGYDCDLVRVGFRRGAWALQVNRNDWCWDAPGFRSFYVSNHFRFRGDGWLGYGPRFGGWISGPIGSSPFGYYN